MFADTFTKKIGDTTVKGRRLSIREIRECWNALAEGSLADDRCLKVIRDHVTLDDGKPIDPEELTQGQARELIAELTLPKEGRGISDFIGLLSAER